MRDAPPNATFGGFTGTPIKTTDAKARAVFGDYISVNDIQRAVHDGATVPIFYESRLAKLALDDRQKPQIDPDFEEATEGEEVDKKERLKTKWAALEAVVGSEKRLRLIAEDLVKHFETRLEAMEGKAMVVAMSRRIAVELFREIALLRPEWAVDDDEAGALKVVMTGSASDPADWQPHIRNKPRREKLADRFRDPGDPFRIVIVRDMWLTGFDALSLHTMYVDKPMRGHGLMQAIARVNRVFRDKPGGLVVDYLGLADELKQALATYTEAGGEGKTAIDQEEAVAALEKQYEICCGLFGSYRTPAGTVPAFDWSAWTTGTPQERVSLLPAAQEHILGQEDGKARLLRAVTDLSKAFALAVPADEAIRIRDDVDFFQNVRAVLAKGTASEQRSDEELDFAIRQIVSKAVAAGEVVDIFQAAGLQKPDLSILSDDFLAEVRDMPQRNLAVELLQKLLKGEIKPRGRRNVVQARSFSEMLEKSLRKYQNRAIETAQVIEELIGLAKEMRGATRPRREARALGRRAGLLRRTRDQRQRRPGPGGRDPADDRKGARRDRAQERHDRLDPAGERASPAPCAGEKDSSGDMAILRTRRRRPRRPCSSRRRCCRRSGRHDQGPVVEARERPGAMSSVHDWTPLRRALLVKLGSYLERGSAPLLLAYGETVAESKRLAHTPNDFKPISFLTKRTIRSFFALAEIVTTLMNQSLLHLRWVFPIEVPPNVIAEIESIEARRIHRGIDARTQIAFRNFGRLFNFPYEPDFRATGWQKFSDLAKIRNGFTHPARFVDLFAHQALPLILPALLWFLGEIQNIVADCQARVGIEPPPASLEPSVRLPKTDHTLKNTAERLFDRAFDEAVRASGSSSIRLLGFWLDIHSYEYGRVMEELRQASSAAPGTMRDLLRRDAPLALVASAESTIGFFRFYLEAALGRGESISEEFRASFEERDVPNQLVAVVNGFSESFGYGKRIEALGIGFTAFEKMMLLRDRLIHPKDEKELDVSDEELERCMEAAVWYFQIYDLLEFDLSRFSD